MTYRKCFDSLLIFWYSKWLTIIHITELFVGEKHMNYENFFDLQDKPFRQSPDTEYFFSSNTHKELMHHLLYSIAADDGFVTITGEPGIGKTITVRSLLNQVIGDKVNVSLILNPRISPHDLLLSIALDFGMDEDMIENAPGEKLLRMLHQHLKSLDENEIVPLVIIDEAQDLSNESLEQLCLVSNLETEKKKLVKIILLGQVQLAYRLKKPELKKIDNRITIRYHLKPLSKKDMVEYIDHRLRVASTSGASLQFPFSEKVFSLIYKYSKGVPRLINVICERTLMAACAENTRTVTENHVKKAMNSFQDIQKPASSWKPILITLMLICCAFMIFRLIDTPDQPSIDIELSEEHHFKSQKTEAVVPTDTITQKQTPEPKPVTSATQDITKTMIQPQPTEIAQAETNDQKPKTDKSQIKQWASIPQDAQELHKQWSLGDLFTKNSYFIVLSPDINRMVVWQGMPNFSNLTSTQVQLKEGIYFMEKAQPIAQILTTAEQSAITENLKKISDSPEKITPTEPVPQSQPEKTDNLSISATQNHLSVAQSKSLTHTPENKDGIPEHILSLPEGQIIAVVSLDLKELSLWKGTQEGSEKIKEEKFDFSIAESIYILCLHKGKPCLFNPYIAKHITNKMAVDLWKKLTPSTIAIPVIVRFSNKPVNAMQLKSSKGVTTFVDRWDSAWQQKNLSKYMDLYSRNKIYFYKLNAQPIQLRWEVLKSSQSNIFSASRHKVMHVSPAIYLMDPGNPNHVIAVFNQRYADSSYSEKGVKVFYLQKNVDDWEIFGRLWVN